MSEICENPHNHEGQAESAVVVALLGRFYERFADHAVEMGRRVIFQATGEIADA
jgi:phosphate transport system protein